MDPINYNHSRQQIWVHSITYVNRIIYGVLKVTFYDELVLILNTMYPSPVHCSEQVNRVFAGHLCHLLFMMARETLDPDDVEATVDDGDDKEEDEDEDDGSTGVTQ